jgi:hypothetical protein
LRNVPLLAYVRAPEQARRPHWEPNWRVWRWVLAALVTGFAAAHSGGALSVLLVFAVFALVCRALSEALPWGDGLSDWRQ